MGGGEAEEGREEEQAITMAAEAPTTEAPDCEEDSQTQAEAEERVVTQTQAARASPSPATEAEAQKSRKEVGHAEREGKANKKGEEISPSCQPTTDPASEGESPKVDMAVDSYSPPGRREEKRKRDKKSSQNSARKISTLEKRSETASGTSSTRK